MFSSLLAAVSLLSAASAAPHGGKGHRDDDFRGALAAYAPYAPSCVSDIQIKQCSTFDCTLDGYHKINQSLIQTAHSESWNYVFYKVSRDDRDCLTDLKVFAPDADMDGWKKAEGAASMGFLPSEGPVIGYQKDPRLQTKGSVVESVVLKAGIAANRTLGYSMDYTNLGLGGNVGDPTLYADWKVYDAQASAWMYLSWAKGGPIPPISNLTAVSCPLSVPAWQCGRELIANGWERSDIDLNGYSTNASHVFLFTKADEGHQCLTRIEVTKDVEQADIKVNLNEGSETGTPIWLKASYGPQSRSKCITRIAPAEQTVFWDQEFKYDVVSDADGNPYDLNLGVQGNWVESVYLFYSTMKEEIVPNPEGSLYNLAFNESGDFVIALFSDLHLNKHIAECRDTPDNFECSDLKTTEFIERVLDQLKPDLMIINGDLMSFSTPEGSTESLDQLQTRASLVRISKVARVRNIPWAVTLGNHDNEGDATREEIFRLVQQLPYSVSFRGVPELPGHGNYHLDILKRVKSNDVGHRLWFFDSGSQSYLAENGTSVAYGMVEPQTVDWFSKRAAEFNKVSKVPSSAFFHIPLAEISDEILNMTAKLEPIIGYHGESICSQGNNCGNDLTPKNALFQAFVDAETIKSTWSGHDHENDFIQFRDGIALGYDGAAGYASYSAGDPNYNREMRVIALKDFGAHASTYKVIDDISAGTVHRNTSESIVTLF